MDPNSPDNIADTIYVNNPFEGRADSNPPHTIAGAIRVCPCPENLLERYPGDNSPSNAGRLLRLRINREEQLECWEQHPTGTPSYPCNEPVSLGGPLGHFESLVSMSFSRDLLYFDKPLGFRSASPQVGPLKTCPWPITKIAINIDTFKFHVTEVAALRRAVDNSHLTRLILVFTIDLFQNEEEVPGGVPDDLGLVHIAEDAVKKDKPDRHAVGLEIAKAFNGIDDNGFPFATVDYSFAMDEETYI